MGRKWGNFSDPGTYTYWTKVHLAEPGEKNTGKYVCKSVDKPDVNVHFHVFVPGKDRKQFFWEILNFLKIGVVLGYRVQVFRTPLGTDCGDWVS